MSQIREESTLTITLTSIAISLGLLAVPNELLDIFPKFALGLLIGSLGIIFREIVILRESREGSMHKDKKSKILSLRFINSLIMRIFQITPLIVWFSALFSAYAITLIVGFLFLAFGLSVNEHYRLWK